MKLIDVLKDTGVNENFLKAAAGAIPGSGLVGGGKVKQVLTRKKKKKQPVPANVQPPVQ